MITGGEPADPEVCRTALRAAPWARLLNAYGLTETTITSALFDVGAGLPSADQPEKDTVPVGRPVGRARITVVDEELTPVAAGTAGEICIGGPPVARGYLGRPALTAERFVADPGGAPGSRMYRTGDLGRWLESGNLEVVGRMDRQLKVRGFRVEPGEIETVLAGHPDINQVSVVASTRSSGDVRLVAYYTPSAGATAKPGTGTRRPPAATFRSYLLDRLPGYMIPAAFIARHRLPTSAERDQVAAGQSPLDHTAPHPTLPRPRSPRSGARPTPTQSGLAALWARLLHREHIGLDDDFFALGGNSLLAAEMLASTQASFRIPADSVRGPGRPCWPPERRRRSAGDRLRGRSRARRQHPRRRRPVTAEAGLAQPARDPADRRDRVPRRPPAARTARRHRRAHLVPGPSAGRG
jgi:hypothetical protein